MAERESETVGTGGRRPLQDARTAVRDIADQQKRKVASRLDGVAQALHDTARGLEGRNDAAGRYADMAAEQIDRMTQALKERRVEDLLEDAGEFARRQPSLFIGGALAAGFALARVVKSGDAGTARRAARDLGREGNETLDRAAGAYANQNVAPDDGTDPAAHERAQQTAAGTEGTGGVAPRGAAAGFPAGSTTTTGGLP